MRTNGHAPDVFPPRMAPSSPYSPPGAEWMGSLRGRHLGQYTGPPPLPRAEPRRTEIEPPCFRCPHYLAAVEGRLERQEGLREGTRRRNERPAHEPNVDRRDHPVARPYLQENRSISITDAKILARYWRMKAAHRWVQLLRLHKAPRASFVALALVLFAWGFVLVLH